MKFIKLAKETVKSMVDAVPCLSGGVNGSSKVEHVEMADKKQGLKRRVKPGGSGEEMGRRHFRWETLTREGR